MTIPPPDAPSPAPVPPGAKPPEPLDGFSPEEFRVRREALRAACPDGLILVRGATEAEVAKPANFRQSSAFFYLTGIDTPDAFLVLLPDSLPASVGVRGSGPDVREVLFLPARNPDMEAWTGPKLGPGEETEQAAGLAKTANAANLIGAISGWIRRNPVVYTLAPYGPNAKTTRDYALMEQIAAHAPVVQFRDASSALGNLRTVKSTAEIDRLRAAIAITAEGHKAARALIRSGAGLREYEIEAAIYQAFRSRGAHLAFASIVGGGVNATVLHYEENHHVLNAGELVVVDIGARFGHYCGDLTRTYAVGGAFSPRQREIYALVLEAHARTVSEYRPGEDSLSALSARCKEFLKSSPLRAKDSKGVEQTMDVFMPHSLGHHLGLDVHDGGDGELPLLPGAVITVEPGIYLPSEGIGVRIEDDYLITDRGMERLGPALEKGLEEIEAL